MRIVRQAARAGRMLLRQGPAPLYRRLAFEARRALARRLSPLPFLRERPHLPDLIGMASVEEQAWLYHFARHEYRGDGEIVDLGCWFGASTIALAAGLAENREVTARTARLQAFDLFRWEQWMEDSLAGTPLIDTLREGDSFLPQFEEQIAPWRSWIQVFPGDLTVLGWPLAKPIELLFNDAAKSWALANAIKRDFFPSLLPGVSVVVEQDFSHYFTPWVHLLQFRLREHFEPLLAIPFSASMAFRVLSIPPADQLAHSFSFEDFPEEEITAAFERSLSLVARPMRPNVWASRVMLEIHRGRPETARALLREGRRRGFAGLDLDLVSALLAEGGS
jgi:hypothetical protein